MDHTQADLLLPGQGKLEYVAILRQRDEMPVAQSFSMPPSRKALQSPTDEAVFQPLCISTDRLHFTALMAHFGTLRDYPPL